MAPENSYYQTKEQIDEDVTFVNAAKSDMANFDKLYDKYYQPVFRFVYQRVDTMEMAAEVTSQTFLKAMVSLPKYKNQGLPFASWLFRVAYNETNLFFRAQKSERRFYLNLSMEHDLADELSVDESMNPEKVLKPLLESLKPDEMELIEMRYFEKRSFQEIASIINITETNAKVKVHRILKKLNACSHRLRQFEIGLIFLLINTLIIVL